jgi:hypothetical protein
MDLDRDCVGKPSLSSSKVNRTVSGVQGERPKAPLLTSQAGLSFGQVVSILVGPHNGEYAGGDVGIDGIF